MKARAVRVFDDKEAGRKRRNIGDVFEVTPARFRELAKKKLVEPVDEQSEIVEEQANPPEQADLPVSENE